MVTRENLAQSGIVNVKNIYSNLSPTLLVEYALAHEDAVLSSTGALRVETGKYSGRSPLDRFIVDSPAIHDKVDWGEVNRPIDKETYEKLSHRLEAYLAGKDVFVFDGFVGADENHRLNIRVINEYAWQNLFVHQMFIRPTAEQLAAFAPNFTVIACPGFQGVPEVDGTRSEVFVILNFDEKKIIIGGSSYPGEIKKSCFTLMNYFLPEKGVCPMHCSANMGDNNDTALFFGLSGTGKTTLSADPNRHLIGDDEHGWSQDGIFNFEGGCYAKCLDLTREGEPQIFDAIRFGSLLENVILDPETRVADYHDDKLSKNTRAAYPIEYIPGAVMSGKGTQPNAIFFLAADSRGVLPPISRLDINQACYHYLSGYTSKMAGLERGITESQATFSAGFGSPFLVRPAGVYADILKKNIEKYGTKVYLINTGWTGGPYGVGHRIPLKYTRSMVTAALTGAFDNIEFVKDEVFGLSMPTSCPDVPADILNPRNTWDDKAAYDEAAYALAALFVENFKTLKGVAPEIIAAGPKTK